MCFIDNGIWDTENRRPIEIANDAFQKPRNGLRDRKIALKQ